MICRCFGCSPNLIQLHSRSRKCSDHRSSREHQVSRSETERDPFPKESSRETAEYVVLVLEMWWSKLNQFLYEFTRTNSCD